jgi:hypothetical protein
MFRALLAHPQEALHKRFLIYCVHIMSIGSGQLTLYARNIPNSVCSAPPKDKQVILETRRGP